MRGVDQLLRKAFHVLVDDAGLEKAMAEDIRTLPWMTEETKKAALAKLKAITNNVGSPKKWRAYDKLTIARDDYYGNAIRTALSDGVLHG